MVLADTSVWSDHLRESDPGLIRLLEDGEVAIHPWIIGEIALGNLTNRKQILDLLRSLPDTSVASESEVHALVEARGLAGKGIGWLDAHLLASSLLCSQRLWTRDKRLLAVARELRSSYL